MGEIKKKGVKVRMSMPQIAEKRKHFRKDYCRYYLLGGEGQNQTSWADREIFRGGLSPRRRNLPSGRGNTFSNMGGGRTKNLKEVAW